MNNQLSRKTVMKKTLNTKTPKLTIVDENDVLNSQFGIEQQNRVKQGNAHENNIDDKLLKYGISCEKLSITVEEDGVHHTCIADHFFVGQSRVYWMESTIILDETHADRLNLKLSRVKRDRKDVTDFVIFFEKNTNQKSRNNIQRYKKILESKGWTVCIGENEINSYIERLNKSEKKSKKIKIAKSIDIPIDKLIYHPCNRKIDVERCRKLAKSIVKEGFISQLNVVPEYKNGKPTGKYVVFEGNHRLHAVTEFCINEWGFVIDELPCVLVDWINSEDTAKVHELLILVNTTQEPWGVRDYVISHLKEAIDRNLTNKKYSYEKLDWLYNITNKKHSDNLMKTKFNETRFFYIFGPVDSVKGGIGKSIDRDIVKNGDYKISKKEFENTMKPFVMDIAMPFAKWFDANMKNVCERKVGDVFIKYLYHDYRDGKCTIEQVTKLIDGFTKLGDKTPVQVKEGSWETMWMTLNNGLV